MKKIVLSQVVLIVALALIASGCSQKQDAAAGKTTVTYWHIFPEGDVFKPVNDELVKRFNESQDEVYVEDIGISFFDYLSKMDTALPAGTGPDVGFNGLDDSNRRAAAGVLVNLDKYIKADNFEMNQFYDLAVASATYNGSVYGLPVIFGGRMFVYNKAMFREAGLDPEVPPKTLQELEEYSDKLTKFGDNGEIKLLGFHPSLGNVNFRDYLVGHNTDFFDANLKPVINDPRNVEVLEWYVNMTNRYGAKQVQSLTEASKTTGIDPFLAEFVAMEINVHDFYKKLSESGMDFGLAPIPTPNSSSLGGGFILEVIDHKNEARAAAAWKFVKFMASEESQRYWAIENKWPTANQRALENYAAITDDPNWKVIIEGLPHLFNTPYMTEVPGWWGLTYPELESAQSKLKPPKQALDDAQKAVELEIENYRATH